MKKFYFFSVKMMSTKKVFMFLVMMFCLFVNTVNAQIAVTVTNNTNTTPNLAASYTSLATALTDLNAVNAMSGPVTLTLAAGTENTPPTGLLLGSATLNPVLNSTNTITIIGAGATTVLNAGVGTATPGSAVPDGILKLVGVDYVTIDGVTFTDTNITNPASMEVGLGIFKLSVTDGSNNNTIRNCIFNMQRVNNAAGTAPLVDGSVGIALMNSTALASTTVLTITAASGASSNNKFYSNTINGGNYGIVLRGFAASSPFTLADTNNDVGGASLATGNTILNFGGAAAAANPTAGIRIVDQWAANVSFNTINNNNGSGVNHVSTLRGIITSGGTSASLAVNNNLITLFGGGTVSQLDGISNATGSTAASNTININNNTLVLNYTTATGATINGITNSATPTTVNINGNNISGGSVIPGTTTHILISGGSPTNLNISNNILNNFSRSSATSGTLRGIVFTSPTTTVINNNTVSNLSYTNIASTGTIDAIYGLSSSVDVTISNNTIYGLTAAGGTIRGITEWGVAGNKNIFGNTIYNFSNTAGYAGTGFLFTGISANIGVLNIYRNKIYGINSLGTAANVVGVSLANSATVCNMYNNIIGQLYTPTATGLNAIRGLDISVGTTVNLYNNSIRLDATSTSVTTFGSSCLLFNTTPTSVDVRNNIFVNASTPAQEGANVATNGISAGIRRSTGTAGTVPANYATTSNKNLYWVNPSAGTNNHAAYVEGTSPVTNLKNTVATLKTFMVNRDQQSVEENPTFISTTGSNANFLHINTITPTAIESGASSIGFVTNDFDGDIRQGFGGYVGTGSSPDIGADEFEGVSTTPACAGTPAATNTNTSAASVCSGVNFNLSLSTAYLELNYTYQWQSSPDGIVPYTNIVGQTTATASLNQTTATFYQCVITCTNSGLTATSTPVQVAMNSFLLCYCPATYASGGGTDNITNVVLNTLSNNTTAAGNPSPYYTYYSALPATNLPQASSQTLSVTVGTHTTQWTTAWIDWNRNGTLEVSESLGAPVNPGASGTANFVFTVPAGASLGLTRLRVRGGDDAIMTTSQACGATNNGFGETEDYDVNIVINPICTGTPVASNTTAPASVCTGTNFNLGLSVAQTGTGITYQWQSSPDGIAPYTDIVGQTATTATLSQTAATYYQCVITCTGSGLTTISTPAQVTMNSFYACYCASTYGSGTGLTGGDAITNVTLGTLNNSSNGGATPTPSPYYTLYNAVTVPNLTQGSGQTMTVSFGTDGSQFVGVWIDYNKDGDLLDAGEFVANNTVTAGASGTATLTFTVPVGATLGNTLMRVRGGNDSVLTDTPCGASSSVWGETEDYIVNITPCIAPSISTQPVSQSVCENSNVTLTVVAAGTGLTYQWKKEGVDIPSATSASYTITGALVAASGNYTVLVTGACGTSLSNVAVVTVTANSSLPTEVVSVCDTYTWSANGTVYTTSGIYTSTTSCVTRTLDLTITPSSSLPTEVVSACDSYTWSANGTVYTTGGIYTSTTSCVTRTLDLTITPSSSLPTEVVSVCDTYTWSANGTVYTTSGIYTSTTSCVTRTLDLTITTSSSLPTEVVSVCDSYTWSANGTVYTTSGIYTSTTACVTRTLDLTITPSSSLPTEVVSACDSYTWSANGTVYTTSGIYTSTTSCVTRTLDLTITPSSSLPTEVVSACDSYTWSANGTVYTTSGIYTSTTACVTRTLDLTITTSSSLPTEVVSVCDSYTWSANGTVYTTSGIYTSTTSCVTRTLDLTITPSSSLPTEVVSACNTYTWSANGTVYTTSGIYTSTTSCVTRTLDLTITTVTTPTGSSTQTLNGGVAADVTIEDIVVSGTGIVWYPTALDATNGTNPIAAGTVLTDNTTYYAVSEIGICRSSALAVTVTVVLGKESFDLSQLNYYPNPVKDIFNVKYNKEIISVDVYDLTGRKVIAIKPNTLEVQLNMTNLSNAMYIVRLQSVDGITELKVYKN